MCVSYFSLSAQEFYSMNTGISDRLFSVNFINDSIGTSVGENGVIIKTIDGGSSWVQQNSGVSSMLRSIVFLDTNKGFIVGENGVVLKTIDGGNTWEKEPSLTTVDLLNISHVGDLIIITGKEGFIARSSDAGDSWNIVSIETFETLYDHSFIDKSTGYIVGNSGHIFKTIDGGITWEQLISETSMRLIDVSFVDSENGIIVGGSSEYDGIILQTSDGGLSWEKNIIPSIFLSSVEFVNNDLGYIIGGDVYQNTASLFKTTDGGSNWELFEYKDFSRQYHLSIPSEDVLFSCGLDGSILKNKKVNNTSDLTVDDCVKIYPNPTSAYLHYSSECGDFLGDINIQIINSCGAILLSQRNTEKVDLSNLPDGLYYCKLYNDSKSIVKKVILNK